MRHDFAFLIVIAAFACTICTSHAATVDVPGDRAWTDTGVDVAAGEPLAITATGEVEISHWKFAGRDGFEWLVGPQGTYLYDTVVKDRKFPLPAAESGPAPCYALIGRVGAGGAPFLVGRDCRMKAPASGRLHLGVNDFDVVDNAGGFAADIALGDAAAARAEEPDGVVYRAIDLPEGRPVKDANVVILYVDGLRDDVLREMADAGYLPAVREIFFDNGTDFASAFTGFPSSTLASNGAMYTGLFTSRTGIKGNNFFDRKRVKGDTLLEPFGSMVAADTLRPAGLRYLGVAMRRGMRSLTAGGREVNARERADEVPLLQDYVRAAGMEYYTTIQPTLSMSPPGRYEVDGSTVVPPFMMHRAKDYADEINIRYGLDLVIRRDARVMNFWFPDVDSSCHDAPRAQFGGGRRALYELDRGIALIAAELKRKGMWDRTYLILLADHGTAGGKETLLQKVDLGRDLFRDPGRGIGVDVRWYDDGYLAKGASKGRFAFLDHGEGECAVYLPHASIDSGDWLTRNGLRELTRYRAGGAAGTVDLVEKALDFDLAGQNLYPGKAGGRPVGLVLVKLAEGRFAVFGQGGTRAVIERRAGENGRHQYRYLPVREISCTPEGEVRIGEAAGADPFGYLEAGLDPAWMGGFRSEREWLEATKYCACPDAVVSVANHLSWDGRIAEREGRFSPDMVLVAARGWSFEQPEDPSGGGHGSLDYETAHIPFLVTGPNVRKGIVLTNAVRTVDLVPTVLTLAGIPYDGAFFDGKALTGFLKAEGEGAPAKPGESLKALLAKLPYSADRPDRLDILAEYERRVEERRPAFLVPDGRYEGHDYERATDVHVIGADIFGLLNREVLADLDQLYDLAYPGDRRQPIRKGLDALAAGYDKLPDRYPKERVRELFFALQIPEFTIGEVPSVIFLSWTGLAGRGVFFRVSLLIKWIEHLFSDVDHALLYPAGSPDRRVVSNVNYLFGGLRLTLDAVSWGTTYYVGNALWDGVYWIEKKHESNVRAWRNQQ